jgi:hypothetical protein
MPFKYGDERIKEYIKAFKHPINNWGEIRLKYCVTPMDQVGPPFRKDKGIVTICIYPNLIVGMRTYIIYHEFFSILEEGSDIPEYESFVPVYG